MSRPRLSGPVVLALAVLLGSGLATLLVALLPLAMRPARLARVVEHVVCGSPAHAQGETMRFRRVPAESVTALDRRRARRTTVVPADPAPPSDLGEGGEGGSEAPPPPDSPLPPTRVDRSGDVMRIGSDVHVEEGEVINGDVFALGGDVRIDGTVRGNVAATGGDVTLGSTAHVDGDVMCMGGRLTEERGAFVGGQRVTALHEGRSRHGRMRPLVEHETRQAVRRAAQGFSAFIWLLIAMGVAWAITRFAPIRTATALETLKREPGMCLVVGLVILLLIAPSAVAMALIVAILCITIIGIPLGVGVVLAYFGALVILGLWGWVVGAIPVGQAIGARASHQTFSLTRAAVIGMLALNGLWLASVAFKVIPFLGWIGSLVGFVAMLGTLVVAMMGAGALLRSRIGQGPGGQWWPLTRRPATAVAVPGTETAGFGSAPPAAGPSSAAPPSPPPTSVPPPPRPEEPPPSPIG